MDPLITVLTPTYNRADLIRNLYDSLIKQECRDFEWVVVDDASQDDTKVLFDQIRGKKAGFEITYVQQPHGGKHRAVNTGVKFARGRYLFIVDSDDRLLSYSIKIVKEWVKEIDDDPILAGVSGLCQLPDKTIVGEFPKRVFFKKADHIDVKNTNRYLFKLMGDKAEIYKTDLLRKYPFPEFENEYFITESVCWNLLAEKGYKIRWHNMPIYICEYHPEGLTNSGANKLKGHKENYQGYCYQVKNSLKQCCCYEAVTFFREYNGTAVQLGKSIDERARDIGLSTFSYLLYLIVEMPIFYAIRMIIKLLRIVIMS